MPIRTARTLTVAARRHRHGNGFSFAHPVIIALCFLVWCCPAGAQMSPPAPSTRPAMPQTPGFHNLYQTVRLNGRDRGLPYSVYLPQGYSPEKPCPMLVYLIGQGDRGQNHDGLYNNGPPSHLKMDRSLAAWMPMIVLSPQCPPDQRWEAPDMTHAVLQVIESAKQAWAVDRQRVYLTGLSMGGTGAWYVAAASSEPFAAIAAISAAERPIAPGEDVAKGAQVYIMAGSADTLVAAASQRMCKALQAKGADVTFVLIPNGGHLIWAPFYANRQFYQMLLAARRGHEPSTRPTADQLLAIGLTVPNTADAELAEPLQRFLPWWFISNCGKEHSPGLHDQLLGRQNVFVTAPPPGDLPCRLLYTVQVPVGKSTTLNLTVAAPPQGRWNLIVRANGSELLRRTIGTGDPASPSPSADRSPNAWHELSVDLTSFVGRKIYLELLNAPAGSPNPEAYWGKVELVTK